MHCPYQTTKNESNKADNLHRDTQKCKLRLSGTLPCPTLPADRRGKRLPLTGTSAAGTTFAENAPLAGAKNRPNLC